jgi:hypothetical protein
MRFELHQFRSQELIREADEYRLAQQVRRAKSAPRATAASTSRPTPHRLLVRLRA